jgi:RNA polymerase sigma-70 factor (ECF subfamily)
VNTSDSVADPATAAALSFTEAYDLHADHVFRFAVARMRNWHDAQDVVAMTFLQAYGLKHRPEASARPWLLGVASNVMRNFVRSARRYRDVIDRIPHYELPRGEPDIEARLDAEAAVSGLLASTPGLGTRDREVLILCGALGYSYQEAGEALDIPVGTVRSRFSRAKRKVRDAHPTFV